MENNKFDEIYDFLLNDIISLWPIWFLIIFIIGNIIKYA